PARQHDRVDALQVAVAVPQRHRLGTGEPHGALSVAVVERSGEGDDADASGHQATFTATTSSITWFERNSAATRCASASTASVTSPSTVSSMRLPMRTSVKVAVPCLASAPAVALPAGSSSSGLGMTSTTMVGTETPGVRGGGERPQSTGSPYRDGSARRGLPHVRDLREAARPRLLDGPARPVGAAGGGRMEPVA